jgi:hypothetical protein
MEIKDVLSYLDIKEADITVDGKPSMDKFKELFNGDAGFLKRALLKDEIKSNPTLLSEITGSRVGAIDTAVNRVAKSLGVELDEETSKAGVEKKIDFIFKTHSKKYNEEVSTLKKELDLKDVDAAVKEYKDKYVKLESKYNDTKSLHDQTVAALEAEKKGRMDFEKSITIKSAHENALGKIKFAKDVDELKKEGFLSILNRSYKLDTDETGKVVVFDAEGKRITNPNKNGHFMEVEELYKHEAVKNKLLATEQSQKFGDKFVTSTTTNNGSDNGAESKRKTFREIQP